VSSLFPLGMLTDHEIAALEAAWAPARSAGVLGSATVQDLWEHTAGYISAVCSSFLVSQEDFDGRIVDVGTGAGVPGLLMAQALPCAEVTLLDAAERRLDHVRRGRRALELEERTTVLHGRVDELAHQRLLREQFDVAVARLLAEPAETLELLLPLVRNGGLLVVSARADQLPQWRDAAAGRLPIASVTVSQGHGCFVALRRDGALHPDWPRRAKARTRTPLLPR